MKSNSIIKSLLHDMPNALRGLHDAFGFDFEQPFTALRFSGAPWTVNKIQKSLTDCGHSSAVFTALLVHDVASWRDSWNVVILNRGTVYATFNHYKDYYDLPSWYRLGYLEPFSHFYRKADFETARKAGADVYIVAQERAYIRKKQETKAIDPLRRYRLTEDIWEYDHTARLIPLEGNGFPVSYHEPAHRYGHNPAVSECFDRSGYPVYERRQSLLSRAAQFRADRQKNAYLASSHQQAQIEELRALIIRLRMSLVQRLQTAQTAEEYRAIARSIGQYTFDNGLTGITDRFTLFCQRTESRYYASVADSDRAYQEIKSGLMQALGREESAT